MMKLGAADSPGSSDGHALSAGGRSQRTIDLLCLFPNLYLFSSFLCFHFFEKTLTEWLHDTDTTGSFSSRYIDDADTDEEDKVA